MKRFKWWRITLAVNGSEYQISFHIKALEITQTLNNTLLIDGQRELVYVEEIVSFLEESSSNELLRLALVGDSPPQQVN